MSTADLGAFAWGDCLALFQHFLTLSLLAVGGAITTVPDMHRFLVLEQHWLSEGQFSASIALAQAAPGPNLLFVSVLAWNVGANAAAGANPPELAWLLPLACASVATIGILAPSTTLTLYAARWVHQNRARLGVRGFKLAMGPIVIGLLLATAWTLGAAHGMPQDTPVLWTLAAVSALLVWKTQIHMLWLIAAGAALGAWGWL
jgi:chromate transporter